ncbi:hypothetical protein ZWY2020_033417 [Hordeum vulgare]|nr:hypothetical protein ZWY2020_033417 [Hordeum vulgare]
MPPRHRASSGYRSIRERPYDTKYAEIQSGDVRVGIGTFETAHEAARAYDAATWRLGRPRAQMNFHDVYTHEQAQDLAPPPRLITKQDRVSTVSSSAACSSPRRTSEPWRSGADATRRTSPPRTPSRRRERQGVARSDRTGVGTSYSLRRNVCPSTTVCRPSSLLMMNVGRTHGYLPRTTRTVTTRSSFIYIC